MKHRPLSVLVIIPVLIVLLCSKNSIGQIGVNYFFPQDGTFSIPLAPLSYSQPITFKKCRYFKLIPGGSVYNIGGMSVTGIPGEYPNNKPLIGPFYSVLISVMPALSIPIGAVDLDFCGGYWGAYNFVPKVNQGNMDKMFMNYEGWDACTSDIDFKNTINHGYVVGMSISIWFNDDQALSPGLFYYVGGSNVGLNGSYTGGKLGAPVETKSVDFSNSRLNYRGFEVQLSLQI